MCSKEASKGSLLYSYRQGFSGFAAKLTEAQVQEISGTLHVMKITKFVLNIFRITVVIASIFMFLIERISNFLIKRINKIKMYLQFFPVCLGFRVTSWFMSCPLDSIR